MEDHEAVRVFNQVTEGTDHVLGQVELETPYGELEFDYTKVSRDLRLDYASAEAEGLTTEGLDIDPEEAEELTDADLMQKIMDAGVDLGALAPDSEKAEISEDIVRDSLEHEELAETEIEILAQEHFSEEVLFGLAKRIVEESGDVGGVTDFRFNPTGD